MSNTTPSPSDALLNAVASWKKCQEEETKLLDGYAKIIAVLKSKVLPPEEINAAIADIVVETLKPTE